MQIPVLHCNWKGLELSFLTIKSGFSYLNVSLIVERIQTSITVQNFPYRSRNGWRFESLIKRFAFPGYRLLCLFVWTNESDLATLLHSHRLFLHNPNCWLGIPHPKVWEKKERFIFGKKTHRPLKFSISKAPTPLSLVNESPASSSFPLETTLPSVWVVI